MSRRREAGRHGVTDLKRVCRILLDLKVTENYLRQYPHLSEKLAAALKRGKGLQG
jgi:hypothetical protein